MVFDDITLFLTISKRCLLATGAWNAVVVSAKLWIFGTPFFDPKASDFEMKFKEIVLKENSFLEDEKIYNMAIK